MSRISGFNASSRLAIVLQLVVDHRPLARFFQEADEHDTDGRFIIVEPIRHACGEDRQRLSVK